MLKNQLSAFDDHIRNVMNDLTKSFKVELYKYAACVQEMLIVVVFSILLSIRADS